MSRKRSGAVDAGPGQDPAAPPAEEEAPDWFARELGGDWEADEPGVYRFVGEPESPFADAGDAGESSR